MRELTRIERETKAKENTILKNAKLALQESLSDLKFRFKFAKRLVEKMEVNKGTQIFMLMCQLSWEVRKRRNMWSDYGKGFGLCLQVLQNELKMIVRKADGDWEKRRDDVEQYMAELNDLQQTKKETRDSLERKVLFILKKCVSTISTDIEYGMPRSRKAITDLLATIKEKRAEAKKKQTE
eukprot:CAMPEP_0174257820 /NCGR_PEP_ID=MMETSP0439-20130205/6927_1 /TAXON_ID=0 /ORGANISM="Stereomyxa ramosa, Strain Chinc5" /LENGTH=180 /DNA_ID=CAMNT_0015341087 /DNA_START=746 /DNA_END=1288 /DNA_ORIENTATION=-